MRLSTCFLLATVAGGLAAGGAVHTWTGPANGLWNTSGNWSPIGVPPSSTTTALIFNPATGQTVQNDIPGTLTLNSLTVTGGSGQVVLTGNPLNFSGSTPLVDISRTGGASIELPLQPGSALRLRNTSPNDLLLRGIISGASGVVVETGQAQLTPVSGPNTFSGGLTVKASGRLRVNGSQFHSGLGTSGMVVENNGSVEVFGNGTVAGPAMTVTGYGDGRGALFSSAISFPSITYSGALSLGGTARVAALESFQRQFILSGGVNLNGHRLEIGTGLQANRDAVVESQGVISGTGEILVTGGTLQFPPSSLSANTFKAAIRVGAFGTVALSPADDTNLGTATNELILDGGSIKPIASGSFASSRRIVLGPGGGTIRPHTWTGPASVSIPSILSGPGQLIVGEPTPNRYTPTITLAPGQTHGGGIRIRDGGLVIIDDDSAIGASGAHVELENGSELDISKPLLISSLRQLVAIPPFSTQSGGKISIRTNVEVAASMTGLGRIVLLPGSAHTNIEATLSGTNFAGLLSVQGIRLKIASPGVFGGPGNGFELQKSGAYIANAWRTGVVEFLSPMTINSGGSFTIDGILDTGPHDVVIAKPVTFGIAAKEGAGTLVLAGNDSGLVPNQTDWFVVRNGRVRLADPRAFPSGNPVTLETNTVFELSGFSGIYNFGGQGSVNLQGAIWTNSYSQMPLEGNVIGPGSIVVTRSMSLSGVNSHTNTIITGPEGGLGILGDAALGIPGAPVEIRDGRGLGGSGIISSSRTITISPDAGLSGGTSDTDKLVVEARIVGVGGLRIGGIVGLANTNNLFTGGVKVTGSTIELAANGSLGAANEAVIFGSVFNEQYNSSGRWRAVGPLHIPATRSIKLDGSGVEIDTQEHELRIDSRITPMSASAGLTKVGSGQLLLNGTNAYPGLTDIFVGTLGGTGRVADVRLWSWGNLAPGNNGIGKFRAQNFEWTSTHGLGAGGFFKFDLGKNGQCDQLELTGSFTGASGGPELHKFVFSGTPEIGTYLLVKRSSGSFQTSLLVSDFSYTAPDGVAGFFSLDATGLKFTVTSAPNPDSDGDGLPDSWEQTYFSGLQAGANGDQDNDGHPNLEEYMAGTNPTNSVSFLQMRLSSAPPSLGLIFSPVLAERSYGVVGRSNVPSANWFPIGGVSVINSGNERELRFPVPATNTFYRLQIAEP